jgi:hypothetical protein
MVYFTIFSTLWLLFSLHLPPSSQRVVIVGATLIDGTGASPIADSVVVIQGKRILAAGTRKEVPIPEDAFRVDAQGKWVIPGLIDMHVHLDEVISPSAFVLYGVTSVRDVGSRLVTLQKLRARAVAGEVLPRLYWMGRNIDEGEPSWWGAVAVRGAEEVPKLLADMAQQGVDGVKLYVRAGPKVTQAVIEEAHRRNWPVTAHLERTLPEEAARWGIDNLEHVSTLFIGLKQKKAARRKGFGGSFEGVPEVDLKAPPTQRLVEILRKHHVAVTPTLTVATMPVEGEKRAEAIYTGWAKIPLGWRAYWKQSYWNFVKPIGWKDKDYQMARAAFRKYMELVGKLDRMGVVMVAGTDTPAPWVLPGAGLLRELELLVQAGLTPMRAIQAATGRAAEVMRKSAEIGTIRPGRYADLVLLDADPLADIRNLRKIHAIYLAGQQVDRYALQEVFLATPSPTNRKSE